MNKRIKKKMFSRLWCRTYKEYKERVGNPWKEYCREQKRMKKARKDKSEIERNSRFDRYRSLYKGRSRSQI